MRNMKRLIQTLCMLLLFVLASGISEAAVLTVTSTADSGAGSLRNQIAAASSGDTINFNLTYPATITLASQLQIGKTLTITGPASESLTISGNGAVRVFFLEYGTGATLTLQNLTISNGHDVEGGGIYNAGGWLIIRNCTISGNSASSVIYATAGGGIYNDFGDTTITNSTISGNSADNGGGILNWAGGVTITNSTISGNTARVYGSGIYSRNTMTITNSTISGNSTGTSYGSGIYDEHTYGPVTVKNSIIASNTGGNCYNAVSNGGNNIDSGTSCGWGSASGSKSNTNPRLGPLGIYGGPTMTRPLLPGSPAIDGASANCPATDQRGVPRGSTCDIGAYESRGFTLTTSGGDNQKAVIDTAFAGQLSVTLTETGGSPLPGASVTFTAPAVGASLEQSDSSATTDANGIALLSVSANGTAGTYLVTADVTGADSATYSLTNVLPPDTALSGQPVDPTNSTTASFAFTGSYGVEPLGFECRLDGGGWSSCSSPDVHSGLNDGSHTFEVRTVDAAGNRDATPASYTWTVDANAPAVTAFAVISPSNSLTIPIVTFTAADNAGLTGYMITTSATPPAAGDPGWSGVPPTSFTVGSNGFYTLYPWARDVFGNVSAIYGSPHTVVTYSMHVISGGQTSGPCENWATACELRYALTSAVSGQVIWAKAGTYTPTAGADRTASFQLKNGVAVYGGFAGMEAILAERNPAVNATILSGDIGTAGSFTDNSYHVVTGGGTDSTAILDGVVITEGNATGSSSNMYGGGMYNDSGSPTLRNITFSGNSASYGGGMYNASGSPTLRNITFSGNSASYGGALTNGTSSPTLTNVTFSGNFAVNYGGGIYNHTSSSPTLTNATFIGNWANSGGVIYNRFSSSSTLINNILWYNDTIDGGPHIFNDGTSQAAVTYSIVEGGYSGAGNIDADPLLDPSGLQDNSGPTMTVALMPESPAINAGSAASCPSEDQRGFTRPQGAGCDIGAYEFIGAILYIKATGLTSGSCDSWANACDLMYAFRLASSGMQAWVAAGTYRPTTGTDRTATFRLKNDVAVYGGFAGTETELTQRNLAANTTILSGDIGAAGNSADNSYHVVNGSGTDNTAMLDGFTITGGNADAAAPHDRGGGITNYSGSPSVAGGSPTIRNVTLSSNHATYGGGIYNYLCSPLIAGVTFSGNSATSGGGIYSNTSNPAITNTTFNANSATSSGGAIFNSGSSPAITNATFSGNSAATSGGGIYNQASSSPAIINSIFWGNTAPTGPQISNTSSTPSVTYSVVEGGYSGAGNISADPLLDPAGLRDNGGQTRTLALLSGSPAIDAGNNVSCPATDQRGITRPQGSYCDMGAFERLSFRVKPAGVTSGSCVDWTSACDLQYALGLASLGSDIWVAAGTYKPTTGTSRTSTFQLKNGVALYGGFAGTETLLAQRDPGVNQTILSGDIGASGVNTDNSYHVVTGSGTDNTAILDGVTITGGNANSVTAPNERGGGIYNNSGSPTIRNVTLTSNSAKYGAGIYNSSSTGPISNVTFSSNWATGSGGGVYNNNSNVSISNVTFSGNSAATNGGAIANYNSTPAVMNVTFSGNSAATNGGAMYNSASSPVVKNSILWGNTAPAGAQIRTVSGTPSFTYSVVQGGCPTGSTCSSVFDADPLLVTLGSYGGFTQTIPLLPGSAAIDAGDDAFCPAADQRDIARPQGAQCDIGAFESRGFTLNKTGGDSQIAVINTVFSSPLLLAVTSAFGEPVNGGKVIFNSPAAGAGLNPMTNIVMISGGAASLSTTANGSAGGPYTVTASAAGAASPLSYQLTNGKGTQMITVTGNAPAAAVYNSSFDVVATSTSGLPVSITTAGACTGGGSGTAVITMASGSSSCLVYYNQAGDGNYEPASQVAESTTLQLSLTVTLSGTGIGGVSGNGINCPGDCTETYNYDADLSLYATAASCSLFDQWTGSSYNSNISPLAVKMTDNLNITAWFIPTGKARNATSDRHDQLIQTAFDSINEATAVQELRTQTFSSGEDVSMNKSVTLSLLGGYACDLQNKDGGSTGLKSLTITVGTLILENIEIMGQ
ncbi:MAG: hypothetical protein C0402_13460 [Thermodesulfovibrio sp.]|nr:hypothetical protein [Thermodesulfovibrio sp.]